MKKKDTDFAFTVTLNKQELQFIRALSDTKLNKDLPSVISAYIKKVENHRARSMGQFNKLTSKGLLNRLYYYQKKTYLNDKKLQKMSSFAFVTKWENSKQFKKIWKKYEKSNFDNDLKPIFVRSSYDFKLRVGTPKNRAALNYEH